MYVTSGCISTFELHFKIHFELYVVHLVYCPSFTFKGIVDPKTKNSVIIFSQVASKYFIVTL